MSQVKVSVIITCFQKEKYLDECINSVLDQSKHPTQIIVVHDGCTTPSSHPEVDTIILGKNHGVAYARNEGVRMSKEPLILFVDADDKLAPDYIERMVLQMVKYDIAYPNVYLSYENKSENQLVDTPWKIDPRKMYNTCQITISSMMHRKVYDELRGFDNLTMYEDWDFWLRAMASGFKFIKADTLLYYRQLGGNRNRQPKDVKERVYKQIVSNFKLIRGKICRI